MADHFCPAIHVDVGPSLRPLRIPPPSAAADGDDESPQLRRISDGVQRSTVFSLDQDFGLDITVLLTFSEDGIPAQDTRESSTDGGLSAQEIAKNMKVRAASDGEEGLCAVCLDGLGREEEEDDRTVGILTCGHEFHASCIRQWLMKKNQCPLCRAVAI